MALLIKWLFPLWLACIPPHDYYVSIFEINYNDSAKSLEITTKAFLDDMEKAVDPAHLLSLGNEDEKSEAEQALRQYYLKHITLLLDGKPARIEFLGHEYQDDLLWMYAEVKGVDHLDKVEVNCRFLLPEFQDQINIINIKAMGETKTSLLQRENSIAQWEFGAK